MTLQLPLLIEPEMLQSNLDHPDLLVVDLCRPQQYASAHIPGAVYLPFSQLMGGMAPAPGALPSEEKISEVLSIIGLTPDTHVVAYDDEGGGWAGRLLWTLEVVGHKRYSYLNGGLHAWAAEQRPLSNANVQPTPSQFNAAFDASVWVSKEQILDQLEHHPDDWVIWDARSPEEYFGMRPGAARNGHIPGAVNYEWIRAMDRQNGLRIRNHSDIKQELAELGIHGDKPIVTHCQSHHRSSFTWMLGTILGYPIKAYPGSWSEWGNDPDTPISQSQP